jgi:peptidyl-prolyl cis-trans isomerase B (cyclophilin B)
MRARKPVKQEVQTAQQDIDFAKNDYQVELETSMGSITLNLWPEKAPNHCKNIIGLSRVGFYDGLIFHRVIKGFVIQGGCPEGSGMGGPDYTVGAEFNEAKHELGVLSMARSQDPDSAGSQFFLCLGRVPHLDRQYTAFGTCADDTSRSVVSSIGSVPTARGDRPVTDVQIRKASVHVKPKA